MMNSAPTVASHIPQRARHGRQWRAVGWTRPLLIGAALVSTAVSLLWTAVSGFEQPRVALAFGVLVALGEFARITLPGGREAAPIATASAMSYAFLFTIIGDPVSLPSPQVVAVVAVGMGLGELPHILVGRHPQWGDLARRFLNIAVTTLLFRPLIGHIDLDGPLWWLSLLLMAAIVVVVWLADSVAAAAIRADRMRTRFGVTLRDEMRAQVAIGMAVGASAILMALSVHVMGLTTLLVFTAPLLVTQVAFRRFAQIRRTYLQTVRALSRVTEIGGYVEAGHSRRVSRLAQGIGRELGMSESTLLELEYAALMHDIGQLSLRDPIPSGATVLASPREQRSIAELGAAIIRKTGMLDGVAELVRRQCEPYLGDGEAGPPPLGSRIIKVANAFDDLVGGSTDQERVDAVLQRLRMDTGHEYDPVVVEALATVLQRPDFDWRSG